MSPWQPYARGLFGSGAPRMHGVELLGTTERPQEAPTALSMLRAAPMPQMAPQRMGTGRMIAGTVGDALLQLAGMRPQFAPAMQEQRAMDWQREQAALAAEQRRQERAEDRANGMADWQARQDYESAHPATPAPTEFERVLAASGLQPGTPEYQALARQYAESRANPMQYLPNGDGTFTVVPRGGTPPQGQPQGRPAIGTRVDRLPTGGPTSPASGNFRP